MREPRGHKDMFGVFLTPPSEPDYDAGLIWIDGTQYSHMCGHGTIAVSMAMVAMGLVPRGTGRPHDHPFRDHCRASDREVAHEGEQVEWCRFENVPAYVAAQDIRLELPGYGQVSADLAWGGNYFGTIDCPRHRPDDSARRTDRSCRGSAYLRARCCGRKSRCSTRRRPHQQLQLRDALARADACQGPSTRCVHVFSAGQLDRSPGGTGTSAMMAMFEARGQLKIEQPIRSEGLLGTGTFEGCLIGETELNGVRAVRPTVKGTAGVLGTARWVIDREDPVAAGFLVS